MNTVQKIALEPEKSVTSSNTVVDDTALNFNKTITDRGIRKEIVRPRMLCEALADSVRERILSHEPGLRPGSLIDECRLASCYGVARSHVRDALKILASEDLVEFRARQGYIVASLTRRDLVQIFDILESLENLAVRRAALAFMQIPEGQNFYCDLLGAAGDRHLLDLVSRLFIKLRLALGQSFDAPEILPSSTFQSSLRDLIAKGVVDKALRLMAHYEIERRDKGLALFAEQTLSFDQGNAGQAHEAVLPQQFDEIDQISDAGNIFRAGAI